MKIIVPKDKGLDINLSRHKKSGWLKLSIYHATDGSRYEWGIHNISTNGPENFLEITFSREEEDEYKVTFIPESDTDRQLIEEMDHSIKSFNREKETEEIWFCPSSMEEHKQLEQLVFFRNWEIFM